MLIPLLWAFLLQTAPSAASPPTIEIEAAESWPIAYPTHHVQGLCVDVDRFWISSVDRKEKKGWVYCIDRKTMTVAKSRDITIGDQYHPGGMQLAGEGLWVPLAEYRPKSTSTILCLDPETLETIRSFPVQDHIGGVAVDATGTIFAANWDCKILHELDKTGKAIGQRPNPTGVAYQDLKWHEGQIWGTGSVGLLKSTIGIVDVIEPTTWSLSRRYKLLGKTADGGTNFGREGFAVFGTDLFLLPEDGPHSTIHRFALPKD